MQEIEVIELVVLKNRLKNNVKWFDDRTKSMTESYVVGDITPDPKKGLIKSFKEIEKDMKNIKNLLINMEILTDEDS